MSDVFGRKPVLIDRGNDGEAGEFERRLKGARLLTAEVLYYMPDHPKLLQTFVWQDLDLSPEFPVLRKFLDFWHRSLDGRLHSVRVASCGIIHPGEILSPAEFRLH